MRADDLGMSLAVGDINCDDFHPAPIPSAQVIEGRPQARSCDLHASRRAGVAMNLWDCTAGRFRWYYGSEEFVQILEGEARITDADGTQRVLRAGDTAHFPANTSFEWEVPEYVRKLAVHRTAKTLPDRIVWKATRMLSRRALLAVNVWLTTAAAAAASYAELPV